MAENQARANRMRNEAQAGGGQSRMDNRDMDSRRNYDERATLAWHSLDPFVQFSEPSPEVPDWQPRD